MISQEGILNLLYGTKAGRRMLSILVRPSVSKVAGYMLDKSWSRVLIPSFIKNNNIDMSQFEDRKYHSYNDFFTRRIKDGMRKFSLDATDLCAPCDSRISIYPITDSLEFTVKGTKYTMKQLLHSEKLAKHYKGGILLLFRLSVDDYHRYSYVDNGYKTRNYHIKGVFHTVNPIANEKYPIYKENTREFSILKSEHFGNILMMEVGAMMVGRIKNHHETAIVKRGQEKGYFEFGGSTVILCLEKDKVLMDADLIERTSKEGEVKVKLGQKIGKSRCYVKI